MTEPSANTISFTGGSWYNQYEYHKDTSQTTSSSVFYELYGINGGSASNTGHGLELRLESDGTTTAYANTSNNSLHPYLLRKNETAHAENVSLAGFNGTSDTLQGLSTSNINTAGNSFIFIVTNAHLWTSGPTVTSITADKIFVPSDTVTNADFTLLKNGSAYANTNISVTLGNFDPVDQPRFYDYSITYNGTAIYSRTIDSKSFHDLYYDHSWTSSPTSNRSTNSNRILNIIGTLPNTANFTVPTITGQTIGTRTFHDLNRSMRVALTYPAGSTHTQFICYFHVSEINSEIKGKFESHTLGVTVFDESPHFTIGAQQTMSHTFTINGSNITISVNDWIYSDQPEGDGYVADVSTKSNGGGKPDRYPLIMTNLFNRNRSIYSIGMTHKDTWDLFL